MEELMAFDEFIICLGEHGQDRINTMYWLQELIRKVRGKIIVINFSDSGVKEFLYECRDKWHQNNFINESIFNKSVIIEENIPCSMKFIYEYMINVSKEDYVLIVGGERLLPYNNQGRKIMTTKYERLTISSNLMEDEDWNTFCLWVDKLYGDFQDKVKGIILNLGIDDNTESVIVSLLDNSENMSIISSKSVEEDKQLNYILSEFYNKIVKCDYDYMIRFIDTNKDFLDKKTYIVMLSQVYLTFGVSNRAIDLLEKNYESLNNQSKKLLADLWYREGNNIDKSKKILDELYKQDKFLKDLMPSILRVYENNDDEIRETWINIALEIDPDNPKVIECYGNWLSHTKKYKEAAKVFRDLKLILDNQYYEIVARINDILNSPPEDLLDVQRYVLQSVQDYPELHNEAILRLVIYYKTVNRSEYITYSLLNDIDYNIDDELVYKLLDIKLDILSDIVTASKALGKLKPHSKEKHAEKINIERIKCIINSIPTLAKHQKGYLDWRKFIDNCQSQDSWFDVVFNELRESIDSLNELEIDKLLRSSFIDKVRCCHDDEKKLLGIKLLRKIRSGEIDDNDIDSIIIGLLKYAEIKQDDELKIWGRYYASIIYSLRGNEQLANNHALTILEYHNRASNEYKNICILLGLISWGNSQFRIGRVNEGVICIIACIKYVNKVKEIYPILEEGLNLIGIFLVENIDRIHDRYKLHISNVLKSLSKYNDNLEFSSNLMSNSLGELEKELLQKINASNEKNIEWAGYIINLVNIYAKNKDYSMAIPIIKNNYKIIMELYKIRIDMRYKVAKSWAKVLFLCAKPSIENYTIAKILLEVAIKDIESKRNIYHKEERATIGEISKSIYVMYIEIVILMNKVFGNTIISEKERDEILERNIINICPKSTIEQKIYNQEKDIDHGLHNKKLELEKLKEEYNILYKSSLGKSKELNDLGIKIQELQDYLTLNHPHYRPLPKIESINFEDIKKSLKDEEIFFQYIKLHITSIQILITNKDIKIINSMLDVTQIDKSLKILDKYIHGNNLNNDDTKVGDDIEILSKQFAGGLLEYCSNNSVNTIYVMPDLSIYSYNLQMSKHNGEYLIDKIKSIINILDYNVLKEKEEIHSCSKFVNRVFGNKNDKNLKLIHDFIQRNKSDDFIIVDSDEDEIETLKSEIIKTNIDTVLMYGHGVDDPNVSNISGSLGMQGNRELIHIEDIIDNIKGVKNIVLISCKGGVPLNKGIETSTGSWAELFETFKGNIIMCKWDVNTESSIYIIERLIMYVNNNIKLDEALLLGIKDSKEKYKDTAYWAGIELWMN